MAWVVGVVILAVASTPGWGAERGEGGGGMEFGYDAVQREAAELAAKPFEAARQTLPASVTTLNYDAYRKILFRRDHAVWRGEAGDGVGGFEVQMFHPGSIFRDTTQLYVVEDGRVEPVRFHSEMFEYLEEVVPHADRLAEGLGFAGFKLTYPLNEAGKDDEVVSFLGASYFRALGRGHVYGTSARGLAIDTAVAGWEEEFPRFTRFWLVRPPASTLGGDAAPSVMFYAVLDSPAVAGAYRFVLTLPTPGGSTAATRLNVRATLYFRHEVTKLGIAPMSSMYHFGEAEPRPEGEFRPEVHDADGLLLHDVDGGWTWRPLQNPPATRISRYDMDSPRGFGLMQRDREFDHYQDLEAGYHRRPSLWVEPVGDWGEGSVELVEFRTDNEMLDNVAAYWVPKELLRQGTPLVWEYNLLFCDEPPGREAAWRVVATRRGGGTGGDGTRRYIVDFGRFVGSTPPGGGGVPRDQPRDVSPTPVVDAGGGEVMKMLLQRNPYSDAWRLTMDIRGDGDEPHEMTATLRFPDDGAGPKLCEIWNYPWTP